MSKVFEEQAIRFLRGEDNPFDACVVPDKPAHEFSDCHVAEVHGDQYEQVCRAIDKFRSPDYRTRRQLHETRALVVRGVRGSGKTHLLHVLRQRSTPTPEIWVCPRYYDPAFPFPEYLLTELVRTLLSTEEPDASARLRWAARELARRLLGEAVAALNLPEWLEWSRPPAGGTIFSPGVKRREADREALLDALAAGASETPLEALGARHGLSAAAAEALVTRHVDRTEIGSGAAVRLRREVLLAFSELALYNRLDRLAALLEQDFAQPEAALPPARADVVTLLLQTLAETLAAVQVPIVFGLDNMERLLAPRGPVDEQTTQSFFNGLAHTIDQTRGLLLVLFVEDGLWKQFSGAITQFAQHRLRQGVRVRDYGCVWDLELMPPNAEQIAQVVQRRMAPLLARAPHADQLAASFPFSPQEVRQIATAGADVLRTALLRLRDRYDELVLPESQRTPLAAAPEPLPAAPPAGEAERAGDVLRQTWEDAAASGRRRLEASRRTSLAQELHTGLGRWLEQLIGQTIHGWRLSEVRSAVTFGDHPAFGSVTLATWRDEQGRAARVALGPILGERRSMPKDLEVKLSALDQRPPLADQLIVLWPVSPGGAEGRQLPPATQQTWDRLATGRPVRLCQLPLTDLAWLLAFPEWLSQYTAGLPAAESPAGFVLERTGYLLADLAPANPSDPSLSAA